MQKQIQNILVLLAFTLTLLDTNNAQRPSYAGSRPGGLSQKDKYHTTSQPTTTTANSLDNTNIINRFGSAESGSTAGAGIDRNSIAFNAPQRPPVGVQVVLPEAVYVPIAATTTAAPIVPQFSFASRVGEGSNTPLGTANAGGVQANTPQRLPLDAHGDQQLVDQLNRIPLDYQPFWFLNYQAIEAHRNGTGPNFSGAVASRGSFFG